MSLHHIKCPMSTSRNMYIILVTDLFKFNQSNLHFKLESMLAMFLCFFSIKSLMIFQLTQIFSKSILKH